MSKVPRVCLNMIVKNEGLIIERLLQSVHPYIDCYCICDTGSTDNTIELISTFAKAHNLPGQIIEEPFQDFGYNRSVSLKKCSEMPNVDYILLLDADMVFLVDPLMSVGEFKTQLCRADAFHVLQGTEFFHYKNIRIVKNAPDLHYWGVTHEHIVLPKGYRCAEFAKNVVFIRDIGDGGSKTGKFTRDIALLTKGLGTHPNNPRYLFYLANSYKNNNQLKEAIDTYHLRIAAGDWVEEIWYSYYSIGNCYYTMGNAPLAIYNWTEACQILPGRIENVFQIVNHYRNQSKYELAYQFYCIAKQMAATNPSPNYLFMENDVYSYKLDYEYSIIGYYRKCAQDDLSKTCMSLLNYPCLPSDLTANILSNYKFYVSQMKPIANENHRDLLTCFASCVQDIAGFQHSSPSFCKINDTEYVLNIRYVNYTISPDGKYAYDKHVVTKNYLHRLHFDKGWKIGSTKCLEYDNSIDNIYVGLEDIRIYPSVGKYLYNCNRGNQNNEIRVEMGELDIETGRTQHSQVLSCDENPGRCEKNWVYCPSGNDEPLIVYSWHPLILGKAVDGKFIKTHTILTPVTLFQHMRGSCNGILIQDEIWFLCHLVSHESKRYYYHCFVILDSKTYAYKKHTRLFTFEKSNIEYCLGCIYEKNDDFIIGYSTMDRTSNFISVSKSVFDSETLMIRSS